MRSLRGAISGVADRRRASGRPRAWVRFRLDRAGGGIRNLHRGSRGSGRGALRHRLASGQSHEPAAEGLTKRERRNAPRTSGAGNCRHSLCCRARTRARCRTGRFGPRRRRTGRGRRGFYAHLCGQPEHSRLQPAPLRMELGYAIEEVGGGNVPPAATHMLARDKLVGSYTGFTDANVQIDGQTVPILSRTRRRRSLFRSCRATGSRTIVR